MSNYLKAGKSLKNMFIATVGAIICQVLLVIPFPFVNSIAMVATMVFTILNLMGLWTVGEDIAECKKAFWFTILGWVVNSIANAANNLSATGTSVIGTLFSIGGSALSLAVTYYVCISAASALRSFGAEEAAASGDRAWKIALWTTIASIVASVLCLIPILNIIGALLAVIATIAALVGMVFYMIFLNKAYKAFGA